MDSTMENERVNSPPQSLRAAWRHCRNVFSASSPSAAWQSLKDMLEALPIWGVVVLVACAVAVVANWSVFVLPLFALGLLVAVHYTVKRAVLSALHEHDRSSHN